MCVGFWRYALDFRGGSYFISSVSRRLHLDGFSQLLAISYRRLINTFSSQNDNASPSIKRGSSMMSLDEVVIADEKPCRTVAAVDDLIDVAVCDIPLSGAAREKRMSAFVSRVACGSTVLSADVLKRVVGTTSKCPDSFDWNPPTPTATCNLNTAKPTALQCQLPPVCDELGLTLLFDASQHVQETGSVLVALSDTSTPRSKKRKQRPKGGDYKGQSEDVPEKRPQKLSPNYFVAVQVTNPEIHSRIGKIQEDIVEQNGLLKHVLISLPTLHLTLMVMHLADDTQINSAKCALDDCRLSVLKSCSSTDLPVLSVAGVGHFNDNVVFAKVDAGAELKRLETIAETVSCCFAERGFPSTDAASRGFKPHITILKMSKALWLRKKGVKKIEPNLYSAYSAEFFGQQTVTSLQLCSMMLPKNKATGYYHIAHEVHLVENIETLS